MKLKPNELVEITWQDSETRPGWTVPADLDRVEPPTVRTSGYYHGCKRVKGKVKWVIVKHSIAEDGEADYTVIPFGCVVSMRRI